MTGSTGMVGEGVLHEWLNHPYVDHVLVINRTPCEVSHPKLQEIIPSDFQNLQSIQPDLSGYNALLFAWVFHLLV